MRECTYKGGLELEILRTQTCQILKFAGTKVVIDTKRELEILCQPFLKNLQSLVEKGEPDYPRFLESTTDAPRAQKISCMIGTLHRPSEYLSHALYATFLEMYSLVWAQAVYLSLRRYGTKETNL